MNSEYISRVRLDNCRRCGQLKDLRMGACFDCADHCDGKRLLNGNHIIWAKDNPHKKWIVDHQTLEVIQG